MGENCFNFGGIGDRYTNLRPTRPQHGYLPGSTCRATASEGMYSAPAPPPAAYGRGSDRRRRPRRASATQRPHVDAGGRRRGRHGHDARRHGHVCKRRSRRRRCRPRRAPPTVKIAAASRSRCRVSRPAPPPRRAPPSVPRLCGWTANSPQQSERRPRQ